MVTLVKTKDRENPKSNQEEMMAVCRGEMMRRTLSHQTPCRTKGSSKTFFKCKKKENNYQPRTPYLGKTSFRNKEDISSF
jgi:hypothetical protein